MFLIFCFLFLIFYFSFFISFFFYFLFLIFYFLFLISYVCRGSLIWKEGEVANNVILVISGRVRFEGISHPDLGEGALVGDMNAVLNDEKVKTTLVALTDCTAFTIAASDMRDYFMENPGFLLHMLNNQYVL